MNSERKLTLKIAVEAYVVSHSVVQTICMEAKQKEIVHLNLLES